MFHYYCLLTSLLLVSSFANAMVLDWNQSQKIALENNADLAATLAVLKSNEFSKKGSLSGFLPKVSAKIQYSEPSELYKSSINASLNVFNGFKDTTAYNVADAKLKMQQSAYRLKEAEIYADLKSIFTQIIYTKNLESLSQEIVERRQENQKLVQLRFEGGLENKGSAMLANAYLAQAQYEKLRATNLVNTAKLEFKKLLNLDTLEDITIKGSIPLSPVSDKSPDFLELAKKTPEFLRAQDNEKYSNYLLTSSQSNFYPDLSLSLSHEKSGYSFLPSHSEDNVFGISLTLPLFDGGKDYYAIQSAKQDYIEAKNNLNYLNKALLHRLQEKYSLYRESIAKLKSDTLFKEAAEQRAKISRAKYNNGLLSFENWDIIENDLISRQKSYLQSLKDRIIAETEWHKILGIGFNEIN